MLHIDRLHFGYPGLLLFEDWSHRFEPGLTWIQGDMGSGKTSLLRLIAGELSPQSGQIRRVVPGLDGPLCSSSLSVAWCSGPVEKATTTARAWLADPMNPSGSIEPDLAQDLCRDLDLVPHLDKPLLALSTGSRQKLAVVAALCGEQDWVALDDPFAGVDAASVRVLRQVFKDLAQGLAGDHGGLIVASHERPSDGPLQELRL